MKYCANTVKCAQAALDNIDGGYAVGLISSFSDTEDINLVQPEYRITTVHWEQKFILKKQLYHAVTIYLLRHLLPNA